MYDYNHFKQEVLKEKHQLLFVTILISVIHKIENTGAINMEEAINVSTSCEGNCNSWLRMAMVDRLVEMKILMEVPIPPEWPAQNRVFLKGKNINKITL